MNRRPQRGSGGFAASCTAAAGGRAQSPSASSVRFGKVISD
ncbi:hypothetical protein ACP70R_047824 [Stipagrostis hirtigluma subsp. patula]